MKRKDLMLAIMLCVPLIGIGHLYAGDKQRGFLIMGIQAGLLVLTGVLSAFLPSIVSTIMLVIFLGVGIWAAYDTVVLVTMINDSIR